MQPGCSGEKWKLSTRTHVLCLCKHADKVKGWAGRSVGGSDCSKFEILDACPPTAL